MSDVLFDTTHDMILMARRNLDQDNWDYICGAAESETSLRRNRMSLDSLAFRPRICRDVSEIDTSVTFLGNKLRIPVLLAPMGGRPTSPFLADACLRLTNCLRRRHALDRAPLLWRHKGPYRRASVTPLPYPTDRWSSPPRSTR